MNTVKKLIRTINLSLATLVLASLSVPQPALAHVLKQDHGISAVLHIPPEDTPSSGVPVVLNVSFADAKGAFSLANCDCQASVRLNEKSLQNAPLRPYAQGTSLNATSTVQFPRVGVYEIRIAGAPKDGSFPRFQLEYTVRVATDANGKAGAAMTSGNGSSVIIIAIGSLAILCLFAYVAIASGPRYKKKS